MMISLFINLKSNPHFINILLKLLEQRQSNTFKFLGLFLSICDMNFG